MKLLPGFNLFDSAFDDLFYDPFVKKTEGYMKTDVTEKDGNYLLDMELPGYKKEDIKLELKDGYLNVSAVRNNETSEKDDQGNIIRQERFSGSGSRSFYVGEGITEKDIKANYDNGELKIIVPKDAPKQVEEKRFIPID